MLLGQPGHEALVDHRVDQVVGRRARQLEGRGDPVQRHRVGLGGEEPEHPQRARRGRHLGHRRSVVEGDSVKARHSQPTSSSRSPTSACDLGYTSEDIAALRAGEVRMPR